MRFRIRSATRTRCASEWPTEVRALFLILLLANILFFAWSRWVAPVGDSGGHPTPSTRDRSAIRLLKEASPGSTQAVGSGGAVAYTPPESATCVSGGPYLDRTAAEQAVDRLSDLGYASRIRASRDNVWVGRWVRIANLATPSDAANALAELKAAGVDDAYLLSDEPPGNVVSLGVFSDPARAEAVAALARRAGFVPQVDDRRREEDVFWVDVDRDANAGLPGLESFEGAGRPGPRLEIRACPPAESVTPATAAPSAGAPARG
jgi:hypothetical protein